VRVPSEEEISENPTREFFVCGGWVDSDLPSVVNVYWHKRQGRFTVYSLLQILEHEMLHVVLMRRLGLQASEKLDNVHRSVFVLLDDEGGRGVFVNQLRIGKEWLFPPYLEEPTDDLLQ